MLNVEEKNDITPLCPHCGASLTTIWSRVLSGMFGKRYVYFCAGCRKCLGISHRKGFWMG